MIAMHILSRKVLILLTFLIIGASISSNAQTELFYSEKIGAEGEIVGSASYNCDTDTFTVFSESPNVSGVSGNADSFQFVYRQLTNDLDIVAKVGSNSSSLAGLMIRSGTRNNQPFALVGKSGSKVGAKYRHDAGGDVVSGNEIAGAAWLRIRREGNSISSFASNDGQSWVLVEKRTLIMGTAVYAGLVAINGESKFEKVNVIGTLEPIEVVDPGPVDWEPNPPASDSLQTPFGLSASVVSSTQINLYWVNNVQGESGYRIERRTSSGTFSQIAQVGANATFYADSGLNPLTRYTYRIAAFNQDSVSDYSSEAFSTTQSGSNSSGSNEPEPPTEPSAHLAGAQEEVFSVHDIGTEVQGETASYDESTDTFSLSASGGEIWGTEDDFRYVYREVTGDVEATVKVSALTTGDEFGKAGIMFRESSSESARHAFLTISAGKGVALERRHTPGGGTTRSGKGNVTTPVWLRLVKEGTYISAFYSEDGDNWAFLSEDIIEFPETISIGLAVAAHSENDSVTADFGELQIVELTNESSTETFISADIGKVGVNGDAAYDSSTNSFIVEASGGDIGFTHDAFHYVFREISGDFESVAKIDSLIAEEDWAKAGLMIRDGFSPDSPYFGIFMAKNVGIVHQNRYTNGAHSNWSKVDGVHTPFWVKLTRSGNIFRAFYSIDGSTWTLMEEENIPLSQTLLIGMALTSHEEGLLAYAEFQICRSPTTNLDHNRT